MTETPMDEAGVVFATGCQLPGHAGAPRLEASDTIVVMMIGWAPGQLVSMRRYR